MMNLHKNHLLKNLKAKLNADPYKTTNGNEG